jgi:hypothetical protein
MDYHSFHSTKSGEIKDPGKTIFMKQRFLVLFLVASLGTITTQAQLPKVSKPTIGNLLTQFAGALKPTSFLGNWASGGKTDWLSAASKVVDAAGAAKSVSSLAGFIKPDMFKSGFSVDGLLKTANTVSTISSAAGLLKNLEGGLKPEAFLSSWASKRSGWLSALNLLK